MRGKEVEDAPKLPGRQASGNATFGRRALGVSPHDVSVKGQRDMVDKQGTVLSGVLDMAEKRRRQSQHDSVMRTKRGRRQSFDAAHSLVERKLIERGLGNIKPDIV